MYYYRLIDHEDAVVLSHEKYFDLETFEKMCKEAPKFYVGGCKLFDCDYINYYLIDNYGFKPLEITQEFSCTGISDENE